MSMAKSKTTKCKYHIVHAGQKPSYLQLQADINAMLVVSNLVEEGNSSNSSMPSFSLVTSPGHQLVESSVDELPDSQSTVTIERVYKTLRREALKQPEALLNTKGHPMLLLSN